MSKFFKCSLYLLFTIFLSQSGLGQDKPALGDTSRNGAIKVFFDCRHCDMNYTRQEIPFVNYVRDV